MWRIVGSAILLLVAIACSERRPAPVGATETEKGKEIESPSESPKEMNLPEKTPKRIEGSFRPQVAGSFYTGNETKLRQEVEGFIGAVRPDTVLAGRDIVGILAPHAGYVYSGPVAGHAYAAVAGRPYSTVVVLALSHRRAAAKAAVLNRKGYDTPLGSIPVDQKAVKSLLGEHGDVFDDNEVYFNDEHSLEVQLPFVQVALPEAEVVPIIVAVHEDDMTQKIGEALFDVFGSRGDVLFVMSSDLSHFFPYDEAVALDTKTLDALEKWDLPGWNAAASKQAEGMCGHRPLQAFAGMFGRFEEAKRGVKLLKYMNSGDTAGDKSRVVGYGAMAFSLEKGIRMEAAVTDFGPFGVDHRRALMALAKKAVRAASNGERFEPDEPEAKLLSDKGAAFVTLKKEGQLRGCIGHVIARVPLFECISSVARAAAIHDTRFKPVRPEELDELEYEISVLTSPEPIKPEDVVVGRDGLIMSRGGRSGLLLPQVPIEWNWDREQFLSSTCRKAGLPLDCWKDPDTTIEAFRAIVWGEEDL